MRLTKKINNNVALGVDAEGRDVVVFGKGVGFPTMPYELAEESQVTRVFHDVSPTSAAALEGIDDAVLSVSSDIVDYACAQLGCKMNPNLPITLADHIQFALSRTDDLRYVENPLAPTVASVYPRELEVGHHALKMVSDATGQELPVAEACSIAIHLVNGEVGGASSVSTIHLVMKSVSIIEGACEIIEREMGVAIDRSSYEFGRFAAHFRYLVARLEDGNAPSSRNGTLFQQAAHDFPESYACARAIDEMLRTKYGWFCSDEELLYLMMHCNRLVSAWNRG